MIDFIYRCGQAPRKVVSPPPLEVRTLRTLKDRKGMNPEEFKARRAFELSIAPLSPTPFEYTGYCFLCQAQRVFTVAFRRFAEVDGRPYPFYSEEMTCPVCKCNGRMRGCLHLCQTSIKPEAPIYLTEETTATFQQAKRIYGDVIGSEFLEDECPLGQRNGEGIRNEDATQLTFESGQLGAVLSFEVLEHIPDYRKALREFCRVLRPGGKLVVSVPFRQWWDETQTRATLHEDGTIEHHEPPDYHGNPLKKPCLCFRCFGWEFVNDFLEAGFSDAYVLGYWSKELAYLAGTQMHIFVAEKAK